MVIKDFLDCYLKNKPPDCILYSEDGAKFKTHKEIFGQTEFMRTLLKSDNCCGIIEIICPCSKREVKQMIEFLVSGKIHCENEIILPQVFENLHKILGFPSNLDSPEKFIFDDQNDVSENSDSFPTKTKVYFSQF